MHYLTQHWSVDPFLFVVLVLAGWHELGLARGGAPRLRSLWFYVGLVVLLIAVDSPVEYWDEEEPEEPQPFDLAEVNRRLAALVERE